MKLPVEIRPVQAADLEALNRAVNEVCAERWYLASVDGFSLESHQAFLQDILQHGYPQVVAIANSTLVGWCDILPYPNEGFTHAGRLGIAVVQGYRGQGIGAKLLQACLAWAQRFGLEKVELQVYADNTRAIALYEQFGFIPEGLKKKARKLGDHYQDLVLMALDLTQPMPAKG